MNSREILQQYTIGGMGAGEALEALERLLAGQSGPAAVREAARARYGIGFLRRTAQYQAGRASVQDLCLNIRDLILVLGSLRLPRGLYNVVKEHGPAFGLVCEEDMRVSCRLEAPEWLGPRRFVEDVYALRMGEAAGAEVPSAGDGLLRRVTVYQNYRSCEQKLAVHTALGLPWGDTLLVSLPTGGGKSLVTQMLAGAGEGLTLVIVPTVALALDQYGAARGMMREKAGIFCCRGRQPRAEREALLSALDRREARLLFTSPEAVLKNSALRRLLDQAAAAGRLDNVVMDEAHVVPDWGVFFRPDFQIFSVVLQKWRELSAGHIRTFLLSATLSDDVVETLFSLFGAEGHNVQLRCDALRQEPRFCFRPVKTQQEQEDKVVQAVRLLPKPMVVYVLEPRQAETIRKRLAREGYRNIPTFTGETGEEARSRVLTGWKQNDYDVVIATSAFGIGVDKPDVRTVLHACCPENLSRFYQEVGRGGRDQLPSLSLLLPYRDRYDRDSDGKRAKGLVSKRILTARQGAVRWSGMLADPGTLVDGDTCTLNTAAVPATMTEEEVEYAGNRNMAWNVNLLLLLHRTGFLRLEDVSYVPETRVYRMGAKLLRPEILQDEAALREALEGPRNLEYGRQVAGYEAMYGLIASPRAMCWGQVFRRLFPLAREVCAGCPADPEGRSTADIGIKLRTDPGLRLPPVQPGQRLKRHMGTYSELMVRWRANGPWTLETLEELSVRAGRCGLGALVLPGAAAGRTGFDGLVLDYDEFCFAAVHTPYLFAGGVLCAFCGGEGELALYQSLNRLKALGYLRVLYWDESATAGGRPARDCVEGYAISFERF